jgi:hypothetical protein
MGLERELLLCLLLGTSVNKVRKGPEPRKGSRPKTRSESLTLAQVFRRRRRPPRRLRLRRLRPPPEAEAVLTDELAGAISVKLAIYFTSSVLLRDLVSYDSYCPRRFLRDR